ncbi:uncharacterized protein L201_001668 [Kwoniella dendrophila CBS 6074]|uniref:TPX2 C-terminal domain-containing protein n=1 Tax=Kwoniella dendrophila CBS 6074 TaxID=1295534 RepID=A0AAX4JN48_9TREE
MTPYARSEDASNPSLTPQSTHLATFSPSSPLLETPQTEINQDQIFEDDEHDDIEELLDENDDDNIPEIPDMDDMYDKTSLTTNDVMQDPILSDLASKQSIITATTGESSSTKLTRGPRMTKLSALRAGLNWDEIRPKRIPTVEDKGEQKSDKSGYKSIGLGITVPSLAEPSIKPRQTKSSQLRLNTDKQLKTMPSSTSLSNLSSRNHRKSLSVPSTSILLPRQNRTSILRALGEKGNEGYRDYEKIQREKAAQKVKEKTALENKEKAKQERLERRKTIGLGSTFSDKPTVEVKQNKTSALRAAGEKGNEGYRDYEKLQKEKQAQMAKEQQALENREKAKKEREQRRKTLGLDISSLNKPDILVKQNKTSALRATGEKGNEGYRDYNKLQEEKEAQMLKEQLAIANKEKAKKEREIRRKTLGLDIISLNKPEVQVRQNKTSELRKLGEKGNAGYRDYEKIQEEKAAQRLMEQVAIENKERAKKEREERRRTLNFTLASFSRPSITPRPNKTSILRSNSSKSITSLSSLKPSISSSYPRARPSTSHSLTSTISALKVSSADNVSANLANAKDQGKRRETIGVKSLGMPSITPRLNRTAMLRAPGTIKTVDNSNQLSTSS